MTWLDKDNNEVIQAPDKAIGFVYLITRTDTGRKYVGKKLFSFSRTKMVNGKKKKLQVESDWRDYYGSNEELKTEVKELGASLFRREILYFCYSKSECNYLETNEIFTRGALITDDYYNHWVTCRITKKHVYSAIKKNDFRL